MVCCPLNELFKSAKRLLFTTKLPACPITRAFEGKFITVIFLGVNSFCWVLVCICWGSKEELFIVFTTTVLASLFILLTGPLFSKLIIVLLAFVEPFCCCCCCNWRCCSCCFAWAESSREMFFNQLGIELSRMDIWKKVGFTYLLLETLAQNSSVL